MKHDPAFGARLQALRESAGLSQAELAAYAGVGLGTLRHYEQGRHGPTWVAVLALCRALGCRPDDFLPENGHDGAH
jgi:transcriptional regulator with XRE-family HTH domain